MTRADSETSAGERFAYAAAGRAGETIASKTHVYGGGAFRHHLLRLQHNPARHRCYPLRTHARDAKARLLLSVNDLRRPGRNVDRLRLLVDDANSHARRWGVRSPCILSLRPIQCPNRGNDRHSVFARIAHFPKRGCVFPQQRKIPLWAVPTFHSVHTPHAKICYALSCDMDAMEKIFTGSLSAN